jgi:hypothetical protein
VQNLITRVSYKVRTVMARDTAVEGSVPAPVPAAGPRAWEDITSGDQKRLQQMIEPLVRALFFQDAAPYGHRVEGSSGFAARVSNLGPKDTRGRTLRELDLDKRLMRYRLSFAIYSEQFDAMPRYALDYVYGRIVEVLQGRDSTGISASLPADERKAITEILIDTKPALADRLRATPVR